MQSAIMIIIATSLIISHTTPDEVDFWVTIMAAGLATGILNLLLVMLLLTPLRDLTNAITSATGAKPRLPLANPNTPRYSNDGFRDILQYVYDSAAAKHLSEIPESAATQSALLETALDQSNAGVIVLDAAGNVIYTNHSAPVRETTDGGRELRLLFEPEDAFQRWLQQCREQSVHAEQTWLRVPDRILGEEDRHIYNISVNYEKGSKSEVVLVAFDATAVFQPEDDELDFIAFAAHELRGPITVIRGYLDVLDIELGDQLRPEQKELMKRLIVSSNRLTGYINNILNTSKYDRRHLRLHLVEDTIANIYDTIRDDMTLRASSQNRLLAVNFPDDLPTVAADHTSVGEVISNMIDNAIKYSNEGGAITVGASANRDFVTVTITDQGIGIPANIIGNLFHKFYRSHRSRETVAGTGIGLYLCKAIVESHGGTIEVASTEGSGSTFSFTIPTYSSVADKLQANDHTNAGLITTNEGWIRNHAKFKG